MKVLLDAMGGDNAPTATIEGAIRYYKEKKEDVKLMLIGKQDIVENEIKKQIKDEKEYLDFISNVEIIHATENIEMEDIPTMAIKNKKDSSMVKGLKILRDGEVDTFISAGNSGALLTGATLIVGRIKGVIRPALFVTMPSKTGRVSMLDVGANTNCDVRNLVQFAQMGSIYFSRTYMKKPRVGLVNIGTEENKGNQLYKDTYNDLKENKGKYNIDFIGNVESRDIMQGDVDLVISDGFTGNIIIKTIEGISHFVKDKLKDELLKNLSTKIKALIVKKELTNLKEELDYRKLGGGIFLRCKKMLGKSTWFINRSFILLHIEASRRICKIKCFRRNRKGDIFNTSKK